MYVSSYVLAFDTANEVIALGLGLLEACDKRICMVASVNVPAHRASNTQLLPHIEALLAEAGVARVDIACVAVGRGPGSFTGVRIAMATAKGIASALGLPLVGISTLDAIAWGVWDACVRGRVLVAADAMRKEVYPVRYMVSDEGILRLDADHVVKADAAAASLTSSDAAGGEPLQITGDALVKYAELFEPCGTLLSEELWTPTEKGLLLAFQNAWRSGEIDPFDAHRH